MPTLSLGLQSRKSVRSYTEQPIEPEKMEVMLKAAMAAPPGTTSRKTSGCPSASTTKSGKIYLTATASISTFAPLGRAATW